MSRKPQLTPAEQRQHLRALERHNAQLVQELADCRVALKQQQNHIFRLVRVLDACNTETREAATC